MYPRSAFKLKRQKNLDLELVYAQATLSLGPSWLMLSVLLEGIHFSPQNLLVCSSIDLVMGVVNGAFSF